MYMRKYEDAALRKDHERIGKPPKIKKKENLPEQLRIRMNLEEEGILWVGAKLTDRDVYMNK